MMMMMGMEQSVEIVGKRNRSTQRKPGQIPFYPPQISHYLTWCRMCRRGGKPASYGKLSYELWHNLIIAFAIF
jgi:hypothetical protein